VADSLFNAKFALASVFGKSDETLKEALVTLGDARRVNDPTLMSISSSAS